MKNSHILFRIQAIFWILMLVFTISQVSITLFGKQFYLVIIYNIILLPIVEIITWPAANLTSSRLWRNYFIGFRWVGWIFWLLSLFFAWALTQI